MKVVIAIDSFKGSMSSMQAGYAAKKGIQKVCDAEVIVKPLADGGEGTMEALVEGLDGRLESVEVRGPLGHTVTARYGILGDGVTAVIEMAQAAGITLIPSDQLDPWRTTTFGVGEMICDAISKGCREFIIGIGGSATTDGGVGMLQALGYELLREDGEMLRPGIQDLDRLQEIKADKVLPELARCRFRIACDVKNPLCGDHGAVYIYGPQKGVKPEERQLLDQKMQHYARRTVLFVGADYRESPGAGAAGGLGFACISYLPNAILQSGIDIVLDAVRLKEELDDADLVITGEGRLDAQTAMGKVPIGVARLAKQYGKPVLAFAGGVTPGAERCNEEGIDAFFPIVRGVSTLEEAMETQTAQQNMSSAVEQVFRLLRMR